MTPPLTFALESVGPANSRATRIQTVVASQFVIAGWTGRNAAAIEHHIEELERIGVPRPSSVPLYYRASASLLTQAATIEALGDQSSGEAEPVLFFAAGEWWLTVGSDHTDRQVETYSVAVSKQMCPKPIASCAWRWRDVADSQDALQLRSRIFEDGRWCDYQSGSFAAIRPLQSLLDGFFGDRVPTEGSFVSCGTLAAIPHASGAAIRPAAQMELEIHDPQRQRSVLHRYAVQTLPIVA